MRCEHVRHSASAISSDEWNVTLSDFDNDDNDTPVTSAHKDGGKLKAASHVVSEKKHKHTASHCTNHTETTAQVHNFLQQKTVLDRKKLQLSLKQDQHRETSACAKQEQDDKKARLAMAQAVLAMDGANEAAKARANQVIISLLDI